MRPEEAEERLRLITDTISEVVWMTTADMSRLLYISPSYERVWGRACGSLCADPTSFIEPLPPDDRARVIATFATRDVGVSFEHEYRIVRPDGAIVWIVDRGYPVRDAAGGVDYFVGVAQDITARKTAQLELDAVAERLRLMSSATRDGLWDWDMVANESWWNDSIYDLLGYDRSERSGYQSWADRVHPDDRARVFGVVDSASTAGRDGWTAEYRVLRRDGTVRDIYDRAYILRDASGTPVRMIGTMMDVTERKSLEAQLRHAQKLEAVGQLAGGIAHDFNNVMQAILLETELMRRVPNLPGEVAQLI